MMPRSVRSTVARVLLIFGSMIVTLLVAWMALQLNGPKSIGSRMRGEYALLRLLASSAIQPDLRRLDHSIALAAVT